MILVYRVVNCDVSYNIGNDAMMVEYMPGFNHIIKDVINSDYARVHKII